MASHHVVHCDAAAGDCQEVSGLTSVPSRDGDMLYSWRVKGKDMPRLVHNERSSDMIASYWPPISKTRQRYTTSQRTDFRSGCSETVNRILEPQTMGLLCISSMGFELWEEGYLKEELFHL